MGRQAREEGLRPGQEEVSPGQTGEQWRGRERRREGTKERGDAEAERQRGSDRYSLGRSLAPKSNTRLRGGIDGGWVRRRVVRGGVWCGGKMEKDCMGRRWWGEAVLPTRSIILLGSWE